MRCPCNQCDQHRGDAGPPVPREDSVAHDRYAGNREADAGQATDGEREPGPSQHSRGIQHDREERLPEESQGHGKRRTQCGECVDAGEDGDDADHAAQVVPRGEPGRPDGRRALTLGGTTVPALQEQDHRDRRKPREVDHHGRRQETHAGREPCVDPGHERDERADERHEDAVAQTIVPSHTRSIPTYSLS